MFELFLILGIIWSIFAVFYKLMDKKESIYREKNEKNAKLIQAKNNKRFIEQLIEKANKSLAPCFIIPLYSWDVPGKNPGTSTKVIIGMLKQSQNLQHWLARTL